VAYSLKIVLDTWLKLSTDQGSKLPEEQKQFVSAGAVIPVANFETVGADHLRVAFGQDPQGRQVFFKGRNTWYVYRPTVQVLRDEQTIAIAQPAPGSSYALKVSIDTWFKLSTLQSSLLPSEQKQFVDAGNLIVLSSYELVKDEHVKVTLGLDKQGRQLAFKGQSTWYIYRPTVQLLRDGKVISLTSSQTTSSGKINASGLRILKSLEGLRLDAYQDAVGVWTIGYGTTSGVVPGMRITQAQAEEFLKKDLATFEMAIANAVKVPLTDDQFSALVSFVYNIGTTNFVGSTLLQLLNQKDYPGAADQLLRWNKGGNQELPGLTRRRQAERALFLGQDFTVFL
jgi:GH24 family phage-related lysozyme (muramidase)